MHEGIFKIPLDNYYTGASSEPALLVRSTLNPSHVQCDNVRGKIYWAEKNNGTTRIMRVDPAEQVPMKIHPELVFEWSHNRIRYPTEGFKTS